jgi:hypothetical protein
LRLLEALGTEGVFKTVNVVAAQLALQRVRVGRQVLEGPFLHCERNRIIDNRMARSDGFAQCVKLRPGMVVIAQQDAFRFFRAGFGRESAPAARRESSEFRFTAFQTDGDSQLAIPSVRSTATEARNLPSLVLQL